MNILGIIWAHCSTSALMVDGEVVAAASEERFSRIKNDERYPKQAIEAILESAGISPAQLDAVVFAAEDNDLEYVLTRKYSKFSAEDNIREQRDYWYPRIYQGKDVKYLNVFSDKIDTEQFGWDWGRVVEFLRNGNRDGLKEFSQQVFQNVVSKHLGIPDHKVHFVQHHRAHGHYAYYASPIPKDKVLILTADAWGDGANATVSLAKGGKIELLNTSANFQLARLYRYMTLLLGMKPDEHEYKVMGLAGYANPRYYEAPYQAFKETQYVAGLGFEYNLKPQDLYTYFRERMEGYRFDAIAGALQAYTEDILVQWARNAVAATGAGRVVFAGGVGMNVKAIMNIAKLPEITDLFVCPSPSDESTAIGAAYVFMHDHLTAEGKDPAKILKPMHHAYLGLGFSSSDTQSAVARFEGDPRFRISGSVDLPYLAECLDQGKLIGRCAGPAEFGARALGNRSILADPRQLSAVKRINQSVKSRDFWMPFAPTILEQRADDYLAERKGLDAPYMTMAFETTPLARRELIAGLHQGDMTCRPQVLRRDQNPSYFALINEFQNLTGVGGVLNTSFNFHGEPIIQSPADACRVFSDSDLDLLILENLVIEKTCA